MMDAPQVATLPDGRLHLHHGPIDLIISAEGTGQNAAFERARTRFDTVLTALVSELDWLTRAFKGDRCEGPVARRMARAVAPLAKDRFVTPMAAVAGAVADEMLSATKGTGLTKVTINNGGDIAFFLARGEVFRAASPTGPIEITAGDPPRGLATSGWRGRSQSLGIADAVTVLATNAARADAAATLIANEIDLPGHPAIERQPAHEIEAIPQLGDRLVTTHVGSLAASDIDAALARGAAYARRLLDARLIASASLLLQGEMRVIGSEETVTGLAADPS